MSEKASLLVFGIGNPGRRDDGLGTRIAERIENSSLPGVDVEVNYQLNAEDALTVSEHRIAVFVDASVNAEEPFTFEPVYPSQEIGFSTHAMEPPSVIALCMQLYGSAPPCYLLAVRGYDWEIGEGLSEKAEQNCTKAIDFLRSFLKK